MVKSYQSTKDKTQSFITRWDTIEGDDPHCSNSSISCLIQHLNFQKFPKKYQMQRQHDVGIFAEVLKLTVETQQTMDQVHRLYAMIVERETVTSPISRFESSSFGHCHLGLKGCSCREKALLPTSESHTSAQGCSHTP